MIVTLYKVDPTGGQDGEPIVVGAKFKRTEKRLELVREDSPEYRLMGWLLHFKQRHDPGLVIGRLVFESEMEAVKAYCDMLAGREDALMWELRGIQRKRKQASQLRISIEIPED